MSHDENISRLRKVFRYFENPEFPSIGPHLSFLGTIGLWHPANIRQSASKRVLFVVTITFFVSQWVKCAISSDVPASLKLILKHAPFHLGIVKACYFQKDHKVWEDFIYSISSMERKQLSKTDNFLNKAVNEYINANRRISYFFWTLAFFTNCFIFSEPYQNKFNENGTNIHLFNGYTPFRNDVSGYHAAVVIQIMFGWVVSAYIISWDCMVFSLLIFFAGQLKIARRMCNNLIDSKDNKQSHLNITEFHQHYITLIRCQKMLDSLISPAMFMYLFNVSVNLGVAIIDIVGAQSKNNLATSLTSFEYLFALLTQLFIFYWYSNEVTEGSLTVSYSLFESEWPDADNSVKKEVILLTHTMNTRLVFGAGPFNEMTLATFIGILKGSYSFYTLLHQTT